MASNCAGEADDKLPVCTEGLYEWFKKRIEKGIIVSSNKRACEANLKNLWALSIL